jgi:hypothetical protein
MIVFAVVGLSGIAQPRGKDRQPAATATRIAPVRWMKAPLSFEPNQGQANPKVQFLSRGPGYSLFLASDEVVLNLQKQRSASTGKARSTTADTLRMALIGANRRTKAIGRDPQAGIVSYFFGNDPKKWRSGIPTFGKVRYSDIYRGVDLVFYGKQRQLEYDFVVAPGADPSRIAWQIAGARSSLDRDGNLVLNTTHGPAGFKKPVLYQTIGETRAMVDGAFTVSGSRIGFRIGSYDHSKPLIIDPVLTYATYLGGSGTDSIGNWTGPLRDASSQGLAIDSKGSVYVTGYTMSTDFPTTKGAYAAAPPKTSGAPSVFVSKFSPDGSSLEYSTYIGGSGWDQAFAIALDFDRNAYITGQTNSDDFPITSGAFQSLCDPTPANPPNEPASDCGADQESAFVTKLNATGTELVYSTFLGGSGGDYGAAIAVDNSGRAYVAGMENVVCNPGDYTYPSCFPTTTGAVIDGTQPGAGGAYYSFVSVFDPTGSQLLYSTLFGDLNGLKTSTTPGNGGAMASGLTLDSNGNFYLVGITNAGRLPTTHGVIQPTSGPIQTGGYNIAAWRGMIAEFYPVAPDGGSSLEYATYLGGTTDVSTQDFISGITTDTDGNAYILGNTNGGDFPVTEGAYQTTCGDAHVNYCTGTFVAKLNPTGTQILWSTYVGGAKQDGSDGVVGTAAIALDGKGNVYIEGWTASNGFPFRDPVEPRAWGVLIAELDPSGSRMLFATKVGTTDIAGGVSAAGMAVDSGDNVYLAGNTDAPDLITTPGAFQPTSPDGPNYVGLGNGFVAKISAHGTATAKLTISPDQTEYGERTTLTVTVSSPSKYASMPTGYVDLELGTKALTRLQLDSTGAANYSTASIPPATYKLAAEYGGDSTYGPVSATANLTVKMIHAATPIFEPGSATFTSVRHVKITDATRDATIYYKTTGANPVIRWTQYTAPITVNSTETITTYAAAKYCMNSTPASATYTTHFPALVETAVSNPPSSVSVGGSFSVTDTVENVGLSTAGASITRYYFSTIKGLTAKSYLLKGSRSVSVLVIGATSTPKTALTVTVPSGVAHANYYLLACADDTNTVAEADPSRRCKASSATTSVK